MAKRVGAKVPADVNQAVKRQIADLRVRVDGLVRQVGLSSATCECFTFGEVVDNLDPQDQGRVRVRLAGSTGAAADVWARVITLSAGAEYGVQMLPRTGESVLVAYLSDRSPLVLGSFWSPPGDFPDGAAPVERFYSVMSPHGATIEIEDTPEDARVLLESSDGTRVTVSTGNSGVVIESSGAKITVTPLGITIVSNSEVKIEAPKLSISAGEVDVDAALVKCSGSVQCDTLIATSVVASSYTPGAGNIW